MSRILWEEAGDIELSEALHGTGIVGKAFRYMCNAGCDPVFLESRLVGLRIYARRPKKHFSAADRRRLRSLARKLQGCAADTARFAPMMAFCGKADWTVDPLRLASTLSRISRELDEASSLRMLIGDRNPSMAEQAAVLMEEVKKQASGPHYKQMATLIGAVNRDPSYSEDELKMAVHRNKPLRKR